MPARESLDVWPALPLIVSSDVSSTSVDNVIVALGHSDRVCQIDLSGVSQFFRERRFYRRSLSRSIKFIT